MAERGLQLGIRRECIWILAAGLVDHELAAFRDDASARLDVITPNPELMRATPPQLSPVATAATELPCTGWTRVFAYLELAPKREVCRDV